MPATTFAALVLTIISCVKAIMSGELASIDGQSVQLTFAVAIFIFGVIVALKGLKMLRKKQPANAKCN